MLPRSFNWAFGSLRVELFQKMMSYPPRGSLLSLHKVVSTPKENRPFLFFVLVIAESLSIKDQPDFGNFSCTRLEQLGHGD